MHEPGCIVPIPTRGQALSQALRVYNQTGRFPVGICRFCGCTEDNACRKGNGLPCGWANVGHSRCNSEQCLEKFRKESARAVERLFVVKEDRP